MTTPQSLIDALHDDMPSTEAAMENAVAVYHAAQAGIDDYKAVADAAKALMSEIVAETGVIKWTTRAGGAQVTAPSVTIAYDAKALDALCASSPELAAVLAPHRRVTERAGSLRVTAVK